MASRLALLLALPLALAAPPARARDVPGFGAVSFANSCTPGVQEALETAVARLHDFDDPREAFVAVARTDPHCAIAWWGAAMTERGNPLAGAPGHRALLVGRAYVVKALAAGPTTPEEAGLIGAMQAYYRDPDEAHGARTHAYEAAMRQVAAAYPDDAEVQAFFALAILEAVDLTDHTYARQREAGAILERVWAANPGHPGAPHYLIHAYDYPPLAAGALAAAHRYAGMAPGSMHAQHMPSHIYSMLGLWQDSIAANRAAAALDDPEARHPAAWLDAADPHGMDFIAYAHLQLGQDDAVAAALALAPPSDERTLVAARYLLERGDWAGAASMPVGASSPLQAVTVRFVRAVGAARTGQFATARGEVAALRGLRGRVMHDDGDYWAGLIDVYAGAADAWIAYGMGDGETGRRLMADAAARDDGREKHILLENKLFPMRELYADLLLESGRPAEALAAYQASQERAPNRLNGFLGAARAARALGRDDAQRFYGDAAALAADASPGRPEIAEARQLSQREP